jgi:hypothetical protein
MGDLIASPDTDLGVLFEKYSALGDGDGEVDEEALFDTIDSTIHERIQIAVISDNDGGSYKEGVNLLKWYLTQADDVQRRAADRAFIFACGYSLRTLIKRDPTKTEENYDDPVYSPWMTAEQEAMWQAEISARKTDRPQK